MDFTFGNSELELCIDSRGAELRSVRDRATGYEYMWQADPAYWKRTSPVLFPLVGNYRDKTARYQNRTYSLPQHGYARDTDFHPITMRPDERGFRMDTYHNPAVSPYILDLEIGYKLAGRTVTVTWTVINGGATQTAHFDIGGHPAFNCEMGKARLELDTDKPLRCGVLNAEGLLTRRTKDVPVQGGLLLTNELFAEDALIIEGNQFHRATLVDGDGSKRVEVAFDAPVAGLWSPAGKNAPFVCIEPWYGRTDRDDFAGGLDKREWTNGLAAGEKFTASYTITFF